MDALRVLFMGTPQFAVEPLKALYEAGYNIVGVVTQPDRPVGRGGKVAMPPVKEYALLKGLSVYQFARLRSKEGRMALEGLAPDMVVTAAFGQILSQRLLDIPRLGTLNVHASLLPAYRGSAPINWALINGETHTGVTIMLTDVGIDTGDMLLSDTTAIEEGETAEDLSLRLSQMGARALLAAIKGYVSGEITPQKQDESQASYYPMLDRQLGEIDWQNMDSAAIVNRVRGLMPWPGTQTLYKGQALKIWQAKQEGRQGEAGRILEASAKHGLIVGCKGGAVRLCEIQLPGSRRMADVDYLRGHAIPVGEQLGNA